MDRLYFELIVDLTKDAPEGPGWYLQIVSEEGRMLQPTPIASEAAYELARDFQRALQGTEGEIPQVSIPQIAESANGMIQHALEQQLQYAEAQARKIVRLRQKLGKLPPQKAPDEAVS